jgi:hypothetical protein
MVPKDRGGMVEGPLDEIPDEEPADQESPVMDDLDPDDVCEDSDQDRHGQQRVQEGPDQPHSDRWYLTLRS